MTVNNSGCGQRILTVTHDDDLFGFQIHYSRRNRARFYIKIAHDKCGFSRKKHPRAIFKITFGFDSKKTRRVASHVQPINLSLNTQITFPSSFLFQELHTC